MDDEQRCISLSIKCGEKDFISVRVHLPSFANNDHYEENVLFMVPLIDSVLG